MTGDPEREDPVPGVAMDLGRQPEVEPESLLSRDRRVLWHPLTQHGLETEPLAIVGARGAHLELESGRRVIDGISSWWCCLLGHGREELIDAMAEQGKRLDHVLLAGATHEPAVALAEKLLEVAPRGLSRVFYSDDGSTAVEVALKMARQFHVHRGEPGRATFLAFEGGYHGDTVGAMSLSDPEPYFTPFAPLLFAVTRLPLELEAVARTLRERHREIAGIVIEPLVQGAAGMRMHDPSFLRAVRELATEHGIPFIADEVMTGFGRTGTLFACERAGISPDLLCLAKGLTNGMLPLAATLATEAIFAAFVAPERRRAFMHGHTFTGNPIACAVARRSLDLVIAEKVPERLAAIGEKIGNGLSGIEHRRLGGIVAFDRPPADEAGYFDSRALDLRRTALEHGVLLRPLGNVVYAMPPAILDDAGCAQVAAAMRALQ